MRTKLLSGILMAGLGAMSLCGQQPAATQDSINLILIGDSTVATFRPERKIYGWGQVLGTFFDGRVKIDNRAISGRSTKTFIEQGDWRKTMDILGKGDVVMIQFGHNDSHGRGKPESTDANTDYKENLRRYVDDVRSKQAFPILVTPMRRGFFDRNGVITQEMQIYTDAMKAVASEKNTICIDLYAPSGKLFQELGKENLDPIFCAPKDRTHFSEKGALIIAGMVIEGLKQHQTPLSPFIKK